MAAYDIITLSELKRAIPASGAGKDTELLEIISRASRRLERHYDRRFIYRAPPSGEAAVVNAQSWANGAITVAAQPNSAGRTLIVTFTSATAGMLTITGLVAGVSTTETFDAANGLTQHGVQFFTGSVTAAAANAAGAGTVTVTTSQGYIEYHSPYCGSSEIRTIEWPIQQVVEVNEDLNLTFAAATALVAGTAYTVRSRRKIARISNLLDFPWLLGRRVVKIRYSAGYTPGTVPQDLKDHCSNLAAWMFRYGQRSFHGDVSVSDGTGTFALSGPPMITSGMEDGLSAYIRGEFEGTGERDFDLEVA
jgi:hypothetical protein